MTDDQRNSIPGWHYGLDPEGEGLVVRSMRREHHELGDALRIHLVDPSRPAEIHLQWFIATAMGPWALWATCAPEEIEAREALLAEVHWFEEPAGARTLAKLRA